MHLVGRNKYTWDQWNAYKIGWMDTMSVLRDISKEHAKDLIVSVHERVSEAPGDRATGVKYEIVKSGDEFVRQRNITGTLDLKIAASIDGAFGLIMGAYFDEYYWLHVVMDGDKPTWKCRVHPDGRRALRTSFMHKEAEQEPDFRRIWR
jgi:hypothetical protein